MEMFSPDPDRDFVVFMDFDDFGTRFEADPPCSVGFI